MKTLNQIVNEMLKIYNKLDINYFVTQCNDNNITVQDIKNNFDIIKPIIYNANSIISAQRQIQILNHLYFKMDNLNSYVEQLYIQHFNEINNTNLSISEVNI